VPTVGGATDTLGQKRKAEVDLSSNVAKAQRQLPPPGGRNDTAVRPIVAPPAAAVPYRGTARPEIAKLAAKPVPKGSTVSSSTSPAIKPERKPAPAPAPAAALLSASAPPKKGSFQEIMARAKAAPQPIIGTIKHKQTEKLSRRERLALQESAKGKSVAVRDKKGRERVKAGDRSRTGSSEPMSRKPEEQSKEKRKPLDLGYKGTMRPVSAEPQYKGTMHLARPGQPRKSAAKDIRRGEKAVAAREKGVRYSGYASYSGEDLEDEDDFASDASSDMEADAFDVEREEELALRVARKEDAEEAKLEAEHRRNKQKMLAKMAAERSKKKPIY